MVRYAVKWTSRLIVTPEFKAQARSIDSVAKFLTGEIKKEIVVPNKLVNIVVVGCLFF